MSSTHNYWILTRCPPQAMCWDLNKNQCWKLKELTVPWKAFNWGQLLEYLYYLEVCRKYSVANNRQRSKVGNDINFHLSKRIQIYLYMISLERICFLIWVWEEWEKSQVDPEPHRSSSLWWAAITALQPTVVCLEYFVEFMNYDITATSIVFLILPTHF